MKKCLIFLLPFLLFGPFLPAQHPAVKGEIIVWLKGNASIDNVLRKTPFPAQTKRLGSSFNIHLLHVDNEHISESAALEWFQGVEEVQFVQKNYLVESRHVTATLPNDPSFASQWSLNNTGQAGGLIDADIDAPEAWDISTGGKSALGDTIVIAVVDEGIDTSHQEIQFWLNHLEIPHNQIDEDKNGFVDDYQGWNFYDDVPAIPARLHGTHVAGIAAAQGNSSFGIAGVNWDAQVLNIAGSSGNQARVIRAYSYAYDMRKRYDESAGQNGAYVVVVNSSFGVNGGDPANFPIWCAMYDSMGQRGILNVVSTTNSFVDVDVVGDMPSTCPSPFVIAVTATDNRDELHTAGFGKQHIDLGAPGKGILSTILNNGLGTLTGTSMAAPHVSGTVTLLHSAASATFQAWYKSFPDSMALLLKACILESTDSLPSLVDSTVTAGRLNLHRSLLSLKAKEATMLACPPVWYVQASEKTDSSFLLSWNQLRINLPVWIRYREAGNSSWNAFSANGHNTTIALLNSCQIYEVQVAAICGNDTSVFSRTIQTESEGCCRPPALSEVIEVTENEVTLSWGPVYAAQSYSLEYKGVDSTNWITVALNDTFQMISNLPICTVFEYRIAIQCDTGLSAYSPVRQFRTLGCGQCLEGSYCDSRATDSQEDDWIQSFQLDTFVNTSGPNNGYGNFSEITLPLKAGQSYPFRLEPGFAALSFSEYWRIWIDYNRDGDFNDTLELAFDANFTTDTAVTGQLDVPADIFSGKTRMRVSMQFLFAPDPCGNFQFGEVEDYCVDIDGKAGELGNEKMRKFVRVYPNPTDGDVFVDCPEANVKWELLDMMGRVSLSGFSNKEEFHIKADHLTAGLYVLRITGKRNVYASKIILK